MKVFIAAMAHEASSFSPIPTNRASFEKSMYFRPGSSAPPAQWIERVSGSAYGEWARLALERGHTIAPGLATVAGPSAPTCRRDYEALREELLDDLRAAMPVDMALLFLHGAQMAEGYDDCEGDVIRRVREIVGPETPIGVELDLHCNITQEMTDNATVIMACKEYPHTDFAAVGCQLFEIMEATAQGRSRPVMAFQRVPMLNLFFTTRQPMRDLVDRTAAMEGKDGVLAVSLTHGFTSADSPHTGAGVLVITENDNELAQRTALALGREFFALREVGGPPTRPIQETIDAALAHSEPGPVVIADGADNPGAGAAGDSTFILRALIEGNVSNAAVAMLWDPVAVQFCCDAGVGARLPLRIGGKVGRMSGDPLDVEAQVTAVNEAPLQYGFAGRKDSGFGPAAAIRVGGVDIVLASRRTQVMSPDVFSELGIDPRERKILVVKSNQHFYARFAPIAATVLYAEAPGTAANNVRERTYRRLNRPIWPLDEVSM